MALRAAATATAGLALVSAVSAVVVVFRGWRRLKRLKDRADVDGDRGDGFIIAVVGDVFVDVLAGSLDAMPDWGGDALLSCPIEVTLGGSAANIGVGVNTIVDSGAFPSSAEVSAVVHGKVGEDSLGAFARAALAERAVAFSETSTAPHQGACVVLTGPKDRAFLTYRGSSASLCVEDIDRKKLLSASHLHVAGFYNCPALWDGLPALLHHARAKGIITSLGPQYDTSRRWRNLDDIFRCCDFFICNEEEALNISRKATVDEASHFFLDSGVDQVVITRGELGAVALVRTDSVCAPDVRGPEWKDAQPGGRLRFEQAAVPLEKVVDTTGAGDSFAAGFLYVWHVTRDVKIALRYGVGIATAKCCKRGGTPRLTKEEILAYLPPA